MLILLFFFSTKIIVKLPGRHQDLSMLPNTFIQVNFLTSTEKSLPCDSSSLEENFLPVLTEMPILYLACTASLDTLSFGDILRN